MPNGLSTVTAAEVQRRLADAGDALAVPPPVVVSEPRWQLRTAAVLRGFFKVDDLAARARAAGGDITVEDLRSFLQLDCEAVTSTRGTGWQLLLAARRETVRYLGSDVDRMLRTDDGVTLDEADLGRTMAESYLRGAAPAVQEQTPDQLGGSLLAIEWLCGVDLRLPAESTLRSHLQLSVLIEPLRSVTDGPVIGRGAELARLAEYVDRRTDGPRHPLVIYGPGGMGKSTVIARFLLDRSTSARALPFSYLTFDRPELLPQRPLGLLAEMIRQLSLQDPGVAAATESTVAALEQTQRRLVGSELERSVGRSASAGTTQRRRP